MDGLDISTLTQIDEEVFENSRSSDDGNDTLPIPDCVGLDSALQDQTNEANYIASSSDGIDVEYQRELLGMKKDSIRREIFEKSIGLNRGCSSMPETSNQQGHVMNIVEKAGMQGIDKERINKIIHETSEGSLFYKRQLQRQEEIHKSIEKMLRKVTSATPEQVVSAQVTCDNMLKDLRLNRKFNRIIVHFDLDMFFAAVEIRDNQEIKDKPVAVGSESMISTSNYIARKFGVRAAMPGFIAKRLCPELLLIKPNGSKYREASGKVFEVLELYDPDFTSMSLDEAYLDLTEHVKALLEKDEIEFQEYYDGTLPQVWWDRADSVVREIRDAIYEKTALTCSAGISCNTMISKIATDMKKPNGQFIVKGYPDDIQRFIHKTPVEKVSGIGKVSAQFLNALDIKTCGDIYEKRQFLPLVFYPINIKFYLRVAIGDGSSKLQSDDNRKSKSIEQSFPAIKDPILLLEKLNKMCEELCSKFLKPYRIRGRTVTIKLKRSTFTTLTRACSLLVSTNDKEVIFKAAKNLLQAELNTAGPSISYRLLGVRLSNLAEESVVRNQLTIDVLLRNQELNSKKDNPIVQKENDIPSSPQSPQSPGSEELGDLLTQENIDDEFKQADVDEINQSLAEVEAPSSKRKLDDRKMEDYFMAHDFQSQFGSSSSTNSNTQSLACVDIEEFLCPFCYRKFAEFDSLQPHAETCPKKGTAIDLYTQASKNHTQLSITKESHVDLVSAYQEKSTPLKSAGLSSTQEPKKPKRKQIKISNLKLSSQPTSISKQNYQTFIEQNSQTFSQLRSPKYEPLQCPYCFHLFKSFEPLQSHVHICSKNKSN